MTPQPHGRGPKILKPDPITQIGAEKEKILAEMKKRLRELGIIVKIPMPAGTVMEITPETALDHLAEKGCPHMIKDFMEKTSEVENIFEAFISIHLAEKFMQAMNKSGSCGPNSQPH